MKTTTMKLAILTVFLTSISTEVQAKHVDTEFTVKQFSLVNDMSIGKIEDAENIYTVTDQFRSTMFRPGQRLTGHRQGLWPMHAAGMGMLVFKYEKDGKTKTAMFTIIMVTAKPVQ